MILFERRQDVSQYVLIDGGFECPAPLARIQNPAGKLLQLFRPIITFPQPVDDRLLPVGTSSAPGPLSTNRQMPSLAGFESVPPMRPCGEFSRTETDNFQQG